MKCGRQIGQYLFWTFAIAWGTEGLLILFYQADVLQGIGAQIFHFAVIGFGAGMAPAYAAFLVRRRESGMAFAAFFRQIFGKGRKWENSITFLLFALLQFASCALQETYLGYPWYFFLLFMPMMILGGGLEEIGWRGIFQPLLEKRFSFLGAALIEGVLWSIWHLPLWFVPNTSQSSYDFIAFTLYCITLGLTLAAAYRLTESVWITVLLHAWGNTVLGGMYTLTSLMHFPTGKTVMVYGIQILFVMLYYKAVKRRRAVQNS